MENYQQIAHRCSLQNAFRFIEIDNAKNENEIQLLNDSLRLVRDHKSNLIIYAGERARGLNNEKKSFKKVRTQSGMKTFSRRLKTTQMSPIEC